METIFKKKTWFRTREKGNMEICMWFDQMDKSVLQEGYVGDQENVGTI